MKKFKLFFSLVVLAVVIGAGSYTTSQAQIDGAEGDGCNCTMIDKPGIQSPGQTPGTCECKVCTLA